MRVGFGWKVEAGRPMNARDWTRWEFDRARELLARATDEPEDGEGFLDRHADDLRNALTHAVWAWCRTHLRCKDASGTNESYYEAFAEKAPEDLYHTVMQAHTAMNRYRRGGRWISTAEVVTAVRGAAEAVLEAASRPPRNKRRFPARLRAGRPPGKPRVRPGSWIDTGRYRPAVVLEMMPDPPHIMRLSYGDEIDEDFRPHIANWKPVRQRKRIPSLKDVFSPGDWIRHPRSGYGRVLAVRHSTMDVDCRGHVATVVPEASLSRWKKVDDPGPGDRKPVGERLPPGTWIERDGSGQGVVLTVEDDVLTVLFPHWVARIVEPGPGDEGPVIWKLDRTALDLHSSWGRRWAWWWLHRDIFDVPVCACCGYPNLGQRAGNYFELEFEEMECIVCGYPDFGAGFDDEEAPRVFRFEGVWRDEAAWDFSESDEPEAAPSDPSGREWEAAGYSLSEARRNYETRGVMFRPGDPGAGTLEKVADLRRSLTRLLDKRMAEPPRWTEEDANAVEEAKRKILAQLAKT